MVFFEMGTVPVNVQKNSLVVVIKDKAVLCLLDSGSEHCIVKREFLDFLGCKIPDDANRVILPVEIDSSCTLYVKFIVSDSTYVPCLLGWDVLSGINAVINFGH